MNNAIYEIANAIAKLFETSAHAQGESITDAEYSEYLECMHEKLLAKVVNFTVLPIVSVCVFVDDASESDIANTRKSVERQVYTNWELKEIDCTSSPIKLDFIEGEYVLFMRAGDYLDPYALREFVYSKCSHPQGDAFFTDEDNIQNDVRCCPTFKTNYSPDTLNSYNSIGNGFMVSQTLYQACGGLNTCSAEDMYDYVLRATKLATQIVHVPFVLYSEMKHQSLPDDTEARRVLDNDLAKNGQTATTSCGLYDGSFRVHYSFPNKLCAGIIVMCNGTKDELRHCLETMEDTTTFEKYKIIIADRGHGDVMLSRYLTALKNNGAAQIMSFAPTDSYASIANKCAYGSNFDLHVFMRSNIEILTPDWIESMAEYAHRDSIGAVGGKILTPDNRIVDCGTVIGVGGWWCSPYFGEQDDCKDMRKNTFVNTLRNTTALCGDCLMINSDAFSNCGGFDESIHGEFAPIELCIRLARMRYKNIYTPYVRLRSFCDNKINIIRHAPEQCDNQRAYDVCRELLTNGDPNYNINFDYACATPTVCVSPYPAIELNSVFLNR